MRSFDFAYASLRMTWEVGLYPLSRMAFPLEMPGRILSAQKRKLIVGQGHALAAQGERFCHLRASRRRVEESSLFHYEILRLRLRSAQDDMGGGPLSAFTDGISGGNARADIIRPKTKTHCRARACPCRSGGKVLSFKSEPKASRRIFAFPL